METMRDIKRRINSVQNTQKITRAMKMVAAAKLRNAQERAENARPFFNKTVEVLSDIFHLSREAREHSLLTERDGEQHLLIMVTGDRGLCGAYNNKIIDQTEQLLKSEQESSLFVLGRKGRDYFQRRNYDIVSEYIQLADYPDYTFVDQIAEEILTLFKDHTFAKVSLIYTHFKSAISQEVNVMQLLPLKPQKDLDLAEEENPVDYIYEPSPVEVLDHLLPQYLKNVIYSALLESKASEFGSRMTAMDSATENANEIIDDLSLKYNRARQASITTEITEIVGGAEALK